MGRSRNGTPERPLIPLLDVVVIGGGPAGSAAAHRLAAASCRVLLVDPDQPTNHKVGEALPGAAVGLLKRLKLPVPSLRNGHKPVRGILSSWGSGIGQNEDFINDPEGVSWRLDRIRFDAQLREAACASGAIFRPGRLVSVQRRRGRWQLGFEQGRGLSCHWLVDATGRSSGVSRRLGARRKFDERLVALYRLGEKCPKPHSDRAVVEAVPEGWWYAAWLPSGIPIAALHVAPYEAIRINAAPDAWQEALSRTGHVRYMLSGARFDGRIRAAEAGGARLDRFGGVGWLACGDAALSVDPLSGHGIYSALQSGGWAAEAILGCLKGRPNALTEYARILTSMRVRYVTTLRSVYSAEGRWRKASFWARRVL
jgi:flavin-dependent dehydrogenase